MLLIMNQSILEPRIIESESPKIRAFAQPASTMILPKNERLIVKDAQQEEELVREEAGGEDASASDGVRAVSEENGTGADAKEEYARSLRSEYLKPSANVGDDESDKR
jgi:hypothetical protein